MRLVLVLLMMSLGLPSFSAETSKDKAAIENKRSEFADLGKKYSELVREKKYPEARKVLNEQMRPWVEKNIKPIKKRHAFETSKDDLIETLDMYERHLDALEKAQNAKK